MGKKALTAAILVLAVLVTVRGNCDSLPEKVDLARGMAVAMAIRKNLDLRATALNSAMAETDVARSRGIYDPFFSASANGGVSAAPGDPFFRTKNANASVGVTQSLPTGGSVTFSPQAGFTTAEFGDPVDTSTDWQSSVGITISQPLLRDAGKETTEVTITLAASALEDSFEQFRFATIDTVFSVITSYNRLYTLRETLESRKSALTSAQEFVEEIRQRKKPGPLQAVEVANAEYAIAQRRRDLVEAERNVRDQEDSLRYLIGMDSQARIIPVDPPSREEPQETGAQAVQAALAYRPDLKQFRTALETSRLLERVARRNTLPALSLTASGGLTGTGGSFGDTAQQLEDDAGTFWSAGLFFSVPIGNAAARNDYLRSRIRTEQVRRQIEALAWRIQDEIESDMRALISARLQMQTADQSLQYAVQRLDGYRQNVRLGTATVQDVINAENDLVFARISQMQAIETFAFSVAKLWRDMGVLLDRQHVHLDVSRPERLMEGTVLEPSPATALPVSGEQVVTPGQEKAMNGEGKREEAAIAPIEEPAAPAVEEAAETGSYTLLIGEYVVTSEMAKARAKIVSTGLAPLLTAGPKREVPMTRLHVGKFPNRVSAGKALAKLRRAGADGFVIRNNEGSYDVYGGSYYQQEGAVREQKQLSARGIKASLQNVSAPVPVLVLTAGSFPTREAAMQEMTKLEQQGLKAVVMEKGSPRPAEATR